MFKTRIVFGVVAVGLLSRAADDKPWQKPVPEWTVDDAHEIMNDSPWAKTTTPTLDRAANDGQRRGEHGPLGVADPSEQIRDRISDCRHLVPYQLDLVTPGTSPL